MTDRNGHQEGCACTAWECQVYALRAGYKELKEDSLMGGKPKKPRRIKKAKAVHHFHAYVDPEDFAWLVGWCSENDTNASREIRRMIREFRKEKR